LAAIRDRLQAMTGLASDADPAQTVIATHRLLGHAPSMLVTATLDDALLVPERPNQPGTTDEWPNWSIALPSTLEAIETDPVVHAVAATLERR
jgi:4-alpha-glucanotransferase